MKIKLRTLMNIVVMIAFMTGYAQDTADQEFELSNYKMRFTFSTHKDVYQSRVLEVEFLAANKKDRKDRIPVADAQIKFYHSAPDTLLLLGEVKTDQSGIAKYTVPASQELTQDEEGFYNFIAKFDATESLKRQKKSVQVKDLFINMDLAEVDSVKIVTIDAFTTDSLGEKLPIEELDIVISIGGMLSRMPLDEVTIEEGTYEFEMPNDIPGDVNGNFQLFAFVDDHDEFGTVLSMADSDWGVFDDIVEPEKNKLWTDAAPIWMYVVLTILLVGAWANYVYAVIKLWRIKKIGANT